MSASEVEILQVFKFFFERVKANQFREYNSLKVYYFVEPYGTPLSTEQMHLYLGWKSAKHLRQIVRKASSMEGLPERLKVNGVSGWPIFFDPKILRNAFRRTIPDYEKMEADLPIMKTQES